MHKTIGNLRVRRKYEMQQQALLIEKMQRSDVENNPEELLNQTEWEAWNDLKRVLGVLKVMEIRIERSILLLNNWN